LRNRFLGNEEKVCARIGGDGALDPREQRRLVDGLQDRVEREARSREQGKLLGIDSGRGSFVPQIRSVGDDCPRLAQQSEIFDAFAAIGVQRGDDSQTPGADLLDQGVGQRACGSVSEHVHSGVDREADELGVEGMRASSASFTNRAPSAATRATAWRASSSVAISRP